MLSKQSAEWLKQNVDVELYERIMKQQKEYAELMAKYEKFEQEIKQFLYSDTSKTL